MSQIFLSYAAEDRDKAGLLAGALAERGWTVWWDRKIPFGKTFDQVIEESIRQARVVMVLWSRASVSSDWVKTEAREGKAREILIPVQLEPAPIPLEFRHVQTADLSDWNPSTPHAQFDELLAQLRPLLAGPQVIPEVDPTVKPAPTPREEEHAPTTDPHPGPPWIKIGVSVVAALVIIGVCWWLLARDTVERPPQDGRRPVDPAGTRRAFVSFALDDGRAQRICPLECDKVGGKWSGKWGHDDRSGEPRYFCSCVVSQAGK